VLVKPVGFKINHNNTKSRWSSVFAGVGERTREGTITSLKCLNQEL